MFLKKGVEELLNKNGQALSDLIQVETLLNNRFADMEEPIRCLILSVASGEPMVMIGPPGTAKSRLIRVFCQLIGMLNYEDAAGSSAGNTVSNNNSLQEVDRRPDYFSYLLTQFTEPSELFGYFDISKLVNEPYELVKLDSHAMQRARVVFLDEIFNASSAILNALLTFLNEREIHDRGKILKSPMRCFFSATNNVPEPGSLSAIYDRLLLRCWVDNEPAQTGRLKKLLEMGWVETHAPGGGIPEKSPKELYLGLLDGVVRLQDHIVNLTYAEELSIDPSSPLFATLADIVEQARAMEISDGSNRRLIKFARIILINRLLAHVREGSTSVEDPVLQMSDLLVFLRFGIDRRDDALLRRYQKEINGKL